jgi:rhamnopyranosyl-N-acetylglucosaminyl-diphospho-decaprenol beta-1,3/1,4-galactofuranosyltransferase
MSNWEEEEAPPSGAIVWAVIVTYHRLEMLSRVVDSLRGQTRPPDRLVIVDNASEELVAARAVEWGAAYVDAGENLGPAGGIALGMREVLSQCGGGEWILLIDDDDPAADSTALMKLLQMGTSLRAADPSVAGVGLVGSRYDKARGSFLRVPDEELREAVPVDYIGGNQLPMYSVEALRAVGVFDRSLFFGFEEAEFGLRLREAGWRLFAHGDLWRESRERSGRLGMQAADPRLSTAAATAPWRRYYAARNATNLATRYGTKRAVLRSAVRGGLGGALRLAQARRPMKEVILPIRGAGDGLLGRMGRTVDPGPSSSKTVGPESSGSSQI